MKTREGFISNSSSASFIIKKKKITEEQLEKIRNHAEEGERLGIDNAKSDPWDIYEGKKFIRGETAMTNFDMEEFFNKIGISNDAYEIRED